jgi:hypothetical protein
VEEASGRRERGPTVPGWSAQGEAGQPPLEPFGAPLRSGAFWCLPESDASSRTSFVLFMQFNPPFSLFWNNPVENLKSPKLVEIVS